MATLDQSGVAIHYELVDGTGPPLVLLHGAMGTSETWRIEGYVDALRNAFRLVLVDLRGHGQSDAPHDPAAYSVDAFVADLAAVLDALGLRSVALCGFSLGGGVALGFAARHPERSTAVVTLDGSGRFVGWEDSEPPESHAAWIARIEREGMGWLVAAAESEGRHGWARMFERADPAAMAAVFRAIDASPRVPGRRLQDLATPLISVWSGDGVDDGIRLPAHAQVVVIPGADHVGVLEHREVVLPLLRSLPGPVSR